MRRLTLKTERLNDLSTEELQAVAGGAAAYTGEVRCLLSFDDCVSVFSVLESLHCGATS